MHDFKICNHNYKEILNNYVEEPMTVEKSSSSLLVIMISSDS